MSPSEWPPPRPMEPTVAPVPRTTVTVAPSGSVQQQMPWRPQIDVDLPIPVDLQVELVGEVSLNIDFEIPIGFATQITADHATIAQDIDFEIPADLVADVAVAADVDFQVPVDLDVDAVVVPDRLMSFTNGGMGQTVAADLSLASQHGLRIPVKLHSSTKRWRVKMRNYDMTGTSKSTLTGKGIVRGTHSSSGNFQGSTVSTIVSGDFSIPGNGTFYTSPWVTNPALQFVAGTEYLIGTGYTMSFASMQTTIGKCWRWTSATNALSGSQTGGSIPVGIPLDFQIEYEVSSATHDSAWLVIGDSIMEGVQGPQGTSSSSITPTEIHKSPPQQWAESAGVLVDNISMAGMTAAGYAMTASLPEFWTRQDLAGALPDGAIIALGSNDAFADRSLAQFQTDIATIMTKVRTYIGEDAPIYMCTVIPRNALTSAQNSVRLAMNSWIKTLPLGIAGYVDMDAVMRNPSSTNTLLPSLTCDTIHPSYDGAAAMAAKLVADVPLLASV